MSNPFAPPTARVADVVAERGSPTKAILLALAVDIGGTLFVAVLVGVAYGYSLASNGATADQVNAALQNIPLYSWPFIVLTAVGTLFSAFGGYVCARIARHSEYRLGGILSFLSVVTGLLFANAQYSVLVHAFGSLLTVGAIMFGIWLGVARNRAV